MVTVTQTVKLKLFIDAGTGSVLAETIRQYATAFNTVTETGWATKSANGIDLHHATYRSLRERLDLVGAYEGLWSPVSRAPAPVNEPNVGSIIRDMDHVLPASPALSARGS
jgi:predicted transposase